MCCPFSFVCRLQLKHGVKITKNVEGHVPGDVALFEEEVLPDQRATISQIIHDHQEQERRKEEALRAEVEQMKKDMELNASKVHRRKAQLLKSNTARAVDVVRCVCECV